MAVGVGVGLGLAVVGGADARAAVLEAAARVVGDVDVIRVLAVDPGLA
jgi:hypothetical protein